MRPPLRITSADNPRLKSVRDLREQKSRREHGLFLAEGAREVSRALAAGLHAQELYWSPELMPHPDLRALTESTLIVELSANLFRKIAYRASPEGLLAVVEQPRWTLADIPAIDPAHPDLWLIAVGTEKPGNLGAMARSAAAAGADGVLVADGLVDVFNPNAIRASTCAVFTLPIVVSSGSELRSWLSARGVNVIVATPEATTPYSAVDLRGPTGLVIGTESTGIGTEWLAAGTRVSIPMAAGVVDSLNAATTAAILLFEAVRQRGLP